MKPYTPSQRRAIRAWDLMGQGYSMRHIAEILGVTYATVWYYRKLLTQMANEES